MSRFGGPSGVDFLAIAETPSSFPDWEGAVYESVRHVPASDEDVVQVLGRGGLTLRVQARLADRAALEALRALVQTRGGLRYRGTVYSAVQLVNVTGVREYAANAFDGGAIVCTLEFRRGWPA